MFACSTYIAMHNSSLESQEFKMAPDEKFEMRLAAELFLGASSCTFAALSRTDTPPDLLRYSSIAASPLRSFLDAATNECPLGALRVRTAMGAGRCSHISTMYCVRARSFITLQKGCLSCTLEIHISWLTEVPTIASNWAGVGVRVMKFRKA